MRTLSPYVLIYQGEPDPLTEEIRTIWQDSKPQQERLNALEQLYQEELAMQITTNKYTPHTVASLSADSAGFDAWVRNFLLGLLDEKNLKIEYGDRAAKVYVCCFGFMMFVACCMGERHNSKDG